MADLNDDFHFAEEYPLAPLEDDCRLLGSLLDDTLRIEVGDDLFAAIERVRALSSCAQELSKKNDTEASTYLAQRMAEELVALPLEAALPLTRAYGQYLNLTSIAETHHSVRTSRIDGVAAKTCDEVFGQLRAEGMSADELYDAVIKQRVEIVLTAHPTQVNRRTLQYKHTRIAALLAQNDRTDMTPEEKELLIEDLVREITALWQTDELRRRKPTPLDEARGGLHIVEQSLWAAMPAYLRKVSAALKKHTGRDLPIAATPLIFGSWMGGDRDGNPNVTAKVTHNVACLARWMAADLYLREVDVLRFELSMVHASDEVWQMARDITTAQAVADTTSRAGPAKPKSGISVSRGDLATPGITLRRPHPASSATSLATSSTDDLRAAQGVFSQMSLGTEAGALVSHHIGENINLNAGLPIPPPIGPFVHTADGMREEVGSPPSEILWSPRPFPAQAAAQQGGGPALAHAVSGSTASGGSSPTYPQGAGMMMNGQHITRSTGSGFHLPTLVAGANSHASPDARLKLPSVGAAAAGTPLQGTMTPRRIASDGHLLSGNEIKQRGLHAAEYHKTTIDAMLNPRHAGATPYRIVLGDVRQKLLNTRRRMEDILAGVTPNDDLAWYEVTEQLMQPLLAIYWSLWECGGGIVAEGRLLDLLRRLACFGVSLMKLDLRQEAPRHTDALTAITEYLGLGSYAEWDEARRLEWLAQELGGKRPLIPRNMPMNEEVQEVIDSFRVAAELGPQSVGAYVISMATRASDVLAVELLKREACLAVAGERGLAAGEGANFQRTVPLFETLSDLEGAAASMRALFSVPWYLDYVRRVHGGHQEVMLGYSDSGKDAGRIAAAWALYNCQEQLVQVCKEFDIRLTLFHGRGGSVGRGGGPMYLAIQSQPPGSVDGSLRITEQGEMVQAKFGIPAVAQRQLEIYTTAVLLATERPPAPAAAGSGWHAIMGDMARVSCEAYRSLVFQNPNFVPYFRQATPEEELVNLNIGSRPARRKKGGGVETLRAIPWIFAWTQTRMVLPAWLGVGDALRSAFAAGHKADLQAMYREWPFFQSTIDLVEMILAKADMRIAALYDQMLVAPGAELELGTDLRRRFQDTVAAVLEVTGHQRLCENNPTLRRLIEMRNPYIDPINIMQAAVLRRLRADPANQGLRDALLITINGIAAGMRNTG